MSHLLPQTKTFTHCIFYNTLHFLLAQSGVADDKVESSANGEEDRGREEQSKPESEKTEEGCGMFLKVAYSC